MNHVYVLRGQKPIKLNSVTATKGVILNQLVDNLFLLSNCSVCGLSLRCCRDGNLCISFLFGGSGIMAGFWWYVATNLNEPLCKSIYHSSFLLCGIFMLSTIEYVITVVNRDHFKESFEIC